MSEMLANRHLFAGRYAEAAEGFEAVLRRYPDRPRVRMKLIGCHVLVGNLRQAVELATGLMREDPDAVLAADFRTQGFPCEAAILAVRDRAPGAAPGLTEASLGTLMLFCDEKRAIEELTRALEINPFLTEIRELRSLVSRHLEARHV